MKSLLLSVLLMAAHVGWAQKMLPYQQLIRLVEVPGAVPVGDSLFMDDAEVAIIHWVEYVHTLQKDSSDALYRSQLPDENAVRQYMRTDWPGDDFTLYYLRSSFYTFQNLPIVGITYTQAASYCRWRSAIVNQHLHTEEYLRKHPKLKDYTFRIEYRLPTVREWELAAAGGLDPIAHPLGVVHPAPLGSKQARKQLIRKEAEIKDCLIETDLTPATSGPVFRMEFTVQEDAYFGNTGQPRSCRNSKSLYGPFLPDYLYSNPPNAYGLYNMIGNVAELTATPGIAKGGSFLNSINDITLQKSFGYTEPQMWLGFRCACTVHITAKQ